MVEGWWHSHRLSQCPGRNKGDYFSFRYDFRATNDALLDLNFTFFLHGLECRKYSSCSTVVYSLLGTVMTASWFCCCCCCCWSWSHRLTLRWLLSPGSVCYINWNQAHEDSVVVSSNNSQWLPLLCSASWHTCGVTTQSNAKTVIHESFRW